LFQIGCLAVVSAAGACFHFILCVFVIEQCVLVIVIIMQALGFEHGGG